MSTVTRYGRSINYLTKEEWFTAKGAAAMFLLQRLGELREEYKKYGAIKRRNPYFGYKELSEMVQKETGIEVEHHLDMGHLVGELSEDMEKLGIGMISSLVVTRDYDGAITPGGGYYKLAAHLGRTVGDKLLFWHGEVNRMVSA